MRDQLSLFDTSGPGDTGNEQHPAPTRRSPAAEPPGPARVGPDLAALGAALPRAVRLGTSSWAFPGWAGIVYDRLERETLLARAGLTAYARHPVLSAVGIDRSFYTPLTVQTYAEYAAQVPAEFRFLVKAPAAVTDAVLRGERGKAVGANPRFLDAGFALDQAIGPAVAGLREKLGALVFQCSPLPRDRLAQPHALLDGFERFFAALRGAFSAEQLTLAVELRDASLLGAPLAAVLARTQVRYCFGVHSRMPSLAAQAAALADLPAGPLIARWNLHAGFAYEEAKAHYAPFDRLVDPDPATRAMLAQLVVDATRAGHGALVTVNNKAEGSAPLSVIELAREVVRRAT